MTENRGAGEVTLAEWEERKAFVGFGEADAQLLGRLRPLAEAWADEVVEELYRHILAAPETRAFLPDDATLRRVKGLQRQYFLELTGGDYGAAYLASRLRVGRVHQRIGLAPRWYMGTYAIYVELVAPRLLAALTPEPQRAQRTLLALLKLIALDQELALATNLAAALRDLRRSGEQYRGLFENAMEGIFQTSPDGRLITANPAMAHTFGYESPGEMMAAINGDIRQLYADPSRRQELLRLLRANGAVTDFVLEGRRRDGTSIWLSANVRGVTDEGTGALRYLEGTNQDITERKRMAEALEHQAHHHPLTDLPNRSLLRARLSEAILAARQAGDRVALLLLDLDRFKEVNGTFGYAWGDRLLQEVGRRLAGLLGPAETLAHRGEDEFAVVQRVADVNEAVDLALRLRESLEAPFTIEGHRLGTIAASVGIALFPDHGEEGETLLRHADVAMNVAKEAHNDYALYSLDQDRHTPERLALLGELQHAIERDELMLHFQPKADLATGAVTGAEALVRWQHPQRGLVPPDQFIALAEQTGLIQPLSRWVLEAAVRQWAAWTKEGIHLPLAINLSMHDLYDPELPEIVEPMLRAAGMAPHLLTVEVTESSVMADPARALATLGSLRSLGCRIAIDDFGTGYASLAHLKRLPADAIKIDQSFVDHMATDAKDRTIVRSIIRMAYHLGLRTVAEGVEDQATWDLLASQGCDEAQGYVLSRPLPAEELTAWLRQRTAG